MVLGYNVVPRSTTNVTKYRVTNKGLRSAWSVKLHKHIPIWRSYRTEINRLKCLCIVIVRIRTQRQRDSGWLEIT